MEYKVYTKVMEEVEMMSVVSAMMSVVRNHVYYAPMELSVDIDEFDTPEEFIDSNFEDLGIKMYSYCDNSNKPEKQDFKIYKRIEISKQTELKEWKLHKEIEINNGELYEQNLYEINGEKCGFEIVYNDNNDDVEIRVDYIQDVIRNPNNDKTQKFYNDSAFLLSNKRREFFKGLELASKESYISKRESIFNIIMKLLKIKIK